MEVYFGLLSLSLKFLLSANTFYCALAVLIVMMPGSPHHDGIHTALCHDQLMEKVASGVHASYSPLRVGSVEEAITM